MPDLLGYASSPQLANHVLSDQHPESPDRLFAIHKIITENDLVSKCKILAPIPVSDEYLLAVHPEHHIQSIKNLNIIYPLAKKAVGLCLGAADSVALKFCSHAFCNIRPPGHHSLSEGGDFDGPAQGQGFCFFNNVAITARYLQNHHKINKILIVDWDYHHGNGTEKAFYDDDSVLYFSTHDWFAYPGTGDPKRCGKGPGVGYNINVPLRPGAGDKDILTAFEKKLLPAAHNFQPQCIIISAGFDSRINDPLGNFVITDNGFSQLTKILTALSHRYCPGKIISILEGGYNLEGMALAVDAHLRALISEP